MTRSCNNQNQNHGLDNNMEITKIANRHMSLGMRKLAFCICENKDADQLRGIRAFVFATRIVQSLYFLYPKFQASGHLVWLYSPVCVGPGRKPRRPVFSQRGSYHKDIVRLTAGVHSSSPKGTQLPYPKLILPAVHHANMSV